MHAAMDAPRKSVLIFYDYLRLMVTKGVGLQKSSLCNCSFFFRNIWLIEYLIIVFIICRSSNGTKFIILKNYDGRYEYDQEANSSSSIKLKSFLLIRKSMSFEDFQK